jgi:hypothetical protein
MNVKKCLIAITAISCTAFGNSAYAGQDSKTMAGSACQFTNPLQVVNPSFAFDGGNITNTSAVDAVVVCPVVRDNIKNTDGTVAVSMRVRGSSGRGVFCTLRSRDRFGAFIKDSFALGGINGPQSMTLDVSASTDSGSYDLNCILPKFGKILTYTVTEFTPTVEQE